MTGAWRDLWDAATWRNFQGDRQVVIDSWDSDIAYDDYVMFSDDRYQGMRIGIDDGTDPEEALDGDEWEF